MLILGKDKEAEQAFSIAIKLNKNYFPAWRNLGLLHIKSKQWDKALEALYQANRIRPEESEILESIGVILLEKGEKEKAREYFLLLSNKEPENVRAKSYLNLYE
ncbi:MAG TPA: tetratricopeptide repeat protein [Candidatus Hydrogenedens sp.]|nr:tetratricopeptide repeat protein [Candidatus Hydrogenedens sp.]